MSDPQQCGTCGNATPWRGGFSACAHRPRYERYPDTSKCRFEPSRWKPESRIQRETRMILAIESLEGRRSSIAEFERTFGAEEGKKLTESVKAAWSLRNNERARR